MPFNRENYEAHRAYDQWAASTPERDRSTDRKVWIAAWFASRAALANDAPGDATADRPAGEDA